MPRVLVVLVVSALFHVQAAAQEPQTSTPSTRLIPYSATLPAAGTTTPAARPRTVSFALYDEAEGGTRLWNETQPVNTDARGHYTAYLGAVTPLPLDIFRSEQARWLEVSVDGKAVPRTMLVAVPYALRAADAETLGGVPASGFMRTDANGRRVRPDGTTIDDPTVDGTGVPNQIAKWSTATTLSSSIVTESFDNRIGIFTPDPTGGGVVDARFTIRHLDNNTAIGVLNTSNQRRFALNTNANGGFAFFDGGLSGTWTQGLAQWNGRIGIGTLVPSGMLHVRSTTTVLPAVIATNDGGIGIVARSETGLAAVRGTSIGSALAGLFDGDVEVNGTLTKTAGSFRIDHPLDPANKYLRHSFVESPDMMNVYNGNVTLDAGGEAWVTLPDWFQALNRDFRYQLTAIGAPGPNLYVASKVSGNRFRIAGGVPGAEVSWQVTGIRQDAWANRHRIQVEENKRGDDAGRYLHPDAFGLGSDMAVPATRPDAGVIVRKH